jgi:hypothetical protein
LRTPPTAGSRTSTPEQRSDCRRMPVRAGRGRRPR